MTKKRIIYALLSVALLSFPWLGGSGVTLLVAFVPLFLLQHDIARERIERKKVNGANQQSASEQKRREAEANLSAELKNRAAMSSRGASKKDVSKKGASKGQKPRRPRLWTWPAAIFALWWGATTWWVGVAFGPAVPLAMIIGAGFGTAAFMLYELMYRNGWRALAYTVLVAAWISYEYIYINGDVSFPWLTLGGGFAKDVMLVQWYEYTGMLGGTLWVWVANLALFFAVRDPRKLKRWIAPVLVIGAPILVSIYMYESYEEPTEMVSVEVVQPNFDAYTKFSGNFTQDSQTAIFLEIIGEGKRNMDYILLPETAINENIWQHEMEQSRSLYSLRKYILDHAPATTIVAGATTHKLYTHKETTTAEQYGNYYADHFNSAIYIDSTSTFGIHNKGVLVIGVERTPHYIKKIVDAVAPNLGGISGNYGSGTRREVFTSPDGVRTATAICYESIYGEYFTEFVRNGAQVVFVITNDGWWGDTPGHRNHFDYARLRAIETRRSIARSANTGISGFINQRGDVLGRLDWERRGAIDCELALNDKITIYVKYGDLVGRASLLTLALCLLFIFSRRYSKWNQHK